ncbi:unnamed protein product, partial [Nesidiocoris tenuis]
MAPRSSGPPELEERPRSALRLSRSSRPTGLGSHSPITFPPGRGVPDLRSFPAETTKSRTLRSECRPI